MAAAPLIEPDVTVLPQHRPGWLRPFGTIDHLLYRVGSPHVLNRLLVSMLAALAVLLLVGMFCSRAAPCVANGQVAIAGIEVVNFLVHEHRHFQLRVRPRDRSERIAYGCT